MHEWSLPELVGPFDVETFARRFWSARPLVVQRRQPNYYSDLFSPAAVEMMMSSPHLKYPAIRLVKDGREVARRAYARDPEADDGVPAVSMVLDQHQRGATIVLQGVHLSWGPLTQLCRALEGTLHHRVKANAYLTPQDRQGLGLHYDTHDNFVLQIAGAKNWRIFESSVELPFSDQPYNPRTVEAGRVLHELTLGPGDLIYLPRGFVHEASTSGVGSLHVTVGVYPTTWADLILDSLSDCRNDRRFREALPVGFLGPRARPALLERFVGLLETLRGITNIDGALDRCAQELIRARRPTLTGYFADIDGLAALTLETTVRHRRGLMLRLRIDADVAAQIELQHDGGRSSFHRSLEESLAFVAGNTEFKVGAIPGSIDPFKKIVLVRGLIREGVLGIVRGQL